jgi:tetratricopeptide (TPR) repeat protein
MAMRAMQELMSARPSAAERLTPPQLGDAATTQAEIQSLSRLLDWIIDEQPDQRQALLARVGHALSQLRPEDASADLKRLRDLAIQPEDKQSMVSELMNRVRPPRQLGARRDSDVRFESIAPAWEHLLEFFPENLQLLVRAAETRARMADWDAASVWLRKASQIARDDHWHAYRLAPLVLHQGQIEEYQSICRAMFQRFDDSASPLEQSRAVEACLWRPDTVDDPQELVARMQSVFDTIPTAEHYKQTAIGIAHLRAGAPGDAIHWLEEALANQAIDPRCEVRALSALAIAHQENGDPSAAKETLERAIERNEAEAPKAGTDDMTTAWHDWLICEVLLKEANQRAGVDEKRRE